MVVKLNDEFRWLPTVIVDLLGSLFLVSFSILPNVGKFLKGMYFV